MSGCGEVWGFPGRKYTSPFTGAGRVHIRPAHAPRNGCNNGSFLKYHPLLSDLGKHASVRRSFLISKEYFLTLWCEAEYKYDTQLSVADCGTYIRCWLLMQPYNISYIVPLWGKGTPHKKNYCFGHRPSPIFFGTFSPTEVLLYLFKKGKVSNSELLFMLNIYVFLPSSNTFENLPILWAFHSINMGNHENILNICDGRCGISEMVYQSKLPAGSMFFGLRVIFFVTFYLTL